MRSAPAERPRRSPWTVVMVGVAAMGIAAIGVGLALSIGYDRRATQLAREAAALRQEAERQQSLMALLHDPSTRVVTLSGLAPLPNATARLFWNATAGGLLVARELPPAPGGKVYALWAIAGKDLPVPAGVFSVDARGVGSVRVAPIAVDRAVDSFAVTLEPAGGGATPTGATYLAGKVGPPPD